MEVLINKRMSVVGNNAEVCVKRSPIVPDKSCLVCVFSYHTINWVFKQNMEYNPNIWL